MEKAKSPSKQLLVNLKVVNKNQYLVETDKILMIILHFNKGVLSQI